MPSTKTKLDSETKDSTLEIYTEYLQNNITVHLKVKTTIGEKNETKHWKNGADDCGKLGNQNKKRKNRKANK